MPCRISRSGSDLRSLVEVRRAAAWEAVVFYAARILEVLTAEALEAVELPADPNSFHNLDLLQQYNLIPTTTRYWAHAPAPARQRRAAHRPPRDVRRRRFGRQLRRARLVLVLLHVCPRAEARRPDRRRDAVGTRLHAPIARPGGGVRPPRRGTGPTGQRVRRGALAGAARHPGGAGRAGRRTAGPPANGGRLPNPGTGPPRLS